MAVRASIHMIHGVMQVNRCPDCMGPHPEKKIKRLIYPTLTFSALTTRLKHHEQILFMGYCNSWDQMTWDREHPWSEPAPGANLPQESFDSHSRMTPRLFPGIAVTHYL